MPDTQYCCDEAPRLSDCFFCESFLPEVGIDIALSRNRLMFSDFLEFHNYRLKRNKFMGDIILGRALAYMEANYMEKISISDLEAAAGVSRFALSRAFRRHMGVSPICWLWTYRIQIAAGLLGKEPLWSCSAIAYQCGFESPAHFSRKFRMYFGRPPGMYRLACHS
jgi:transcriptional regulator GlxA family with amidase domain